MCVNHLKMKNGPSGIALRRGALSSAFPLLPFWGGRSGSRLVISSSKEQEHGYRETLLWQWFSNWGEQV